MGIMMRYGYAFGLMFLLSLWAGTLWAQTTSAATDPDGALLRARELAFTGKGPQARDTLEAILRNYPDYHDARAFLANTYRWEGAHEDARKHFNRVTSRVRDREDIWVAAVQNELQAGNPSLALGLANKALSFLGESEALEQIRVQLIAASMPQEDKAVPTERRQPGQYPSLSVSNSLEAFDRYYDAMYYGSLEYQYPGTFGKALPRINYSHRFGRNGVQYELDLYPRISKTFYAYANYGFSDSELFPRHRGGIELFANLPKAMEASIGARYMDFRESRASLFTASFGAYRGNYYVSFRPFLAFASGRGPGVSGSVSARKYLGDADQYLGVSFAYGFSPELRQLGNGTTLIAETLLFLEAQQFWVEYQFSGKSRQHRYKARLGISRQEYVLEPGAFMWILGGGLTYSLKI
jgi:YaiO family outer membrane protein